SPENRPHLKKVLKQSYLLTRGHREWVKARQQQEQTGIIFHKMPKMRAGRPYTTPNEPDVQAITGYKANRIREVMREEKIPTENVWGKMLISPASFKALRAHARERLRQPGSGRKPTPSASPAASQTER